jgi:hypothetical protein
VVSLLGMGKVNFFWHRNSVGIGSNVFNDSIGTGNVKLFKNRDWGRNRPFLLIVINDENEFFYIFKLAEKVIGN